MRCLISDYYASADFQLLDESTQKTRRNVLERFCLNQNEGDKPYALTLPRHIRTRRDALRQTPSCREYLSQGPAVGVQTCPAQRSCHLEPRSRG